MDKEQVAKIAKALADPTRLEIYGLISRSPDTICSAVVSHCDLSPATISHHLRVLSEAGLIESRREGQFIHNRAMPETLKAYTQALTRLGNGKREVRR
jgi:ArsR family transcriptional regulator, arsenate/arsenite/antimonite-responsive transcriptional repressor